MNVNISPNLLQHNKHSLDGPKAEDLNTRWAPNYPEPSKVGGPRAEDLTLDTFTPSSRGDDAGLMASPFKISQTVADAMKDLTSVVQPEGGPCRRPRRQ